MKNWFKALAISITAASAIAMLTATASATSGSWAAGTAMGTTRQGAAATVLSDGTVLVTGGETAADTYALSTEVYTSTAGTWAAGTAMSTQRAYHGARVLSDGKVIVMGGYNGSVLGTTEIYNPASPGWTAGASMNTARQKFATAALSNGKIMVIGGANGAGTVLNTTEIYNPTTNTWSAGPNLNTARRGATASTLKDGRVLVVGGNNGTSTLNTTEIYNPSLNTWAVGPTMGTAREDAVSVELLDGSILVAGGYDGAAILNTSEIYGYLTNSFTADATINQASGRRYAAITQIHDGKVLLVGGTNGSYLNTVEIGTFPTTSGKTSTPQLLSIANNGDARDMKVIFKGALNESNIQEYRIFVLLDGTDTTISNGADAAAISTATCYAAEAKNGPNKLHSVTLPQTLTRAGGAAINTTSGSYKAYILAKGKKGFGDTLSTVSTPVAFTISAKGASAKIKAPIVSDANNNHDERDLKVTFRRPKGEIGYTATNTYRIYVVPNTIDDATFRASSWFTNTNYYAFDKLAASSKIASYIKTLTAGTKDSNGAAIAEGTAYRVYIAAIGVSGTVNDSVLSASSRVITLSANTPGVLAVKTLTVAKTGTGFDSVNIKVRFIEPIRTSNIQDYRIFIVNSSATLTQDTANTNATVANNCYVYTPSPLTPSAAREVTLGTGIKAYNGATFETLVTQGEYKVYVLSYSATTYANKLSVVSTGTITLD